MYGGKTRDKNGPIGDKKSKQIRKHYHAKETIDGGLKLASNEGSLIGQRKYIPIRFDVNNDMVSHIILKTK